MNWFSPVMILTNVKKIQENERESGGSEGGKGRFEVGGGVGWGHTVILGERSGSRIWTGHVAQEEIFELKRLDCISIFGFAEG